MEQPTVIIDDNIIPVRSVTFGKYGELDSICVIYNGEFKMLINEKYAKSYDDGFIEDMGMITIDYESTGIKQPLVKFRGEWKEVDRLSFDHYGDVYTVGFYHEGKPLLAFQYNELCDTDDDSIVSGMWTTIDFKKKGVFSYK